MENIWNDLIPEDDLTVYQEAGFCGEQLGLGEKPALVIIDVQNRTVGSNKPILDSIRDSGFKTSCGEKAWSAINKIQKLLNVVRQRNIPVIYVVVERKDKIDAGLWADKVKGMGSDPIHRIGHKGTQIHEEITPRPEDLVISKRQASAFFGTHLITQLNIMKIDSLIVTGCTTSGCVRATVTDAFSYGYKVVVVHDCVYDRSETVHKLNLFDMNAKFADVLSLEELLKILA